MRAVNIRADYSEVKLMYHINWKWKHHPSCVHVRCALFSLFPSHRTSFWGNWCAKRKQWNMLPQAFINFIQFEILMTGQMCTQCAVRRKQIFAFSTNFWTLQTFPIESRYFFAFQSQIGIVDFVTERQDQIWICQFLYCTVECHVMAPQWKNQVHYDEYV